MDEKHAHSACFFFAAHFAIDIGGGSGDFHAGAVIHYFDFKLIGFHGEYDTDGNRGIHLVAMLHGVDAGFGDGGFQVLDSIFTEAHELGHAGGRAHSDFFETETRWKPHLDLASAGHGHSDAFSLGLLVRRQSAIALISSCCGAPPVKVSSVVHRLVRVSSAC